MPVDQWCLNALREAHNIWNGTDCEHSARDVRDWEYAMEHGSNVL